MLVRAHRVAVPDGEPFTRSDPEESRAIAVKGGDRVRGEPAFAAEPVEDQVVGDGAGGAGCGEDAEDDGEGPDLPPCQASSPCFWSFV
jgi:hypothetical protein